jgi:flagellar hook assembly protein FlgD
LPLKVDLGIDLVLAGGGPSKAADTPGTPAPTPEGGGSQAIPNVRVSGKPGSATIALELPRSQMAVVGVYDVAGRLVREVHRGTLEAGAHERTWDGRDERGAQVAGGVYLVRLRTDEADVTKKVVLSR